MSALVLLALAAAVAQPPDIKVRAEAVVTVCRNGPPAESVILDAFRQIESQELTPDQLRTYDTRTLEVLFDAVAGASERLQRPELLQPLEDIFQESLRRGFVGNMVDVLYTRYIQQRDWEKARKLDERFPSEVRQLPQIVGPSATNASVPAIYTVSRDGSTLTYAPIDLAGPIIVSVVSPGCHFSNDLVRLIEDAPELSRLFRKYAVNIDPATYRVDAAGLAHINRKGSFRYTVLYRGADWKGFDFSYTPQFYFVKGGAILYRFDGQHKDDFKARLAEGLAKIGL